MVTKTIQCTRILWKSHSSDIHVLALKTCGVQQMLFTIIGTNSCTQLLGIEQVTFVVFADLGMAILIIHHRLYIQYYACYIVLICLLHKPYYDMYFIIVNIDQDQLSCEL